MSHIELQRLNTIHEIEEEIDLEQHDHHHLEEIDLDQHDHHHLEKIKRSWLLKPEVKKKTKKVDFGFMVCSTKAVKWCLCLSAVAFVVIALPAILTTTLPKHKPLPPPPDNYTVALRQALLFFNAQKSGKLPKTNEIPWRGDSGLMLDGANLTDYGRALVGGYYDGGSNIKFHFPLSFSMTMLSWSVIEYEHKFRAIGEYDHIRDLIKWGTDYILLTFHSNSSNIDKIYTQVGQTTDSYTPDDICCWMRPEDMDYQRAIAYKVSAPDLGSEMAAALAAASIVFEDDPLYSDKLFKGAETVFSFARDKSRRIPYSWNDHTSDTFYNSSGFWDEYIWAGAWMFLASGDSSYLSLDTDSSIAHNAKADARIVPLRIFSWDNKLPGAMLLLTRTRLFLDPANANEETLINFEKNTVLTMCSFLKKFKVFNFTHGGLSELNSGGGHALADVVNAAFLASVYADYLTEVGGAPAGLFCGDEFIPSDYLRQFAISQAYYLVYFNLSDLDIFYNFDFIDLSHFYLDGKPPDYILGNNPANLSYVVGYGFNFPKHVHHRGASIPHNGTKYSCTGGWKWRDDPNPNPNVINGAMVGGPNVHDQFQDVRHNSNYTEPTLVGNAGLVASLVSLTSTGGLGIDRNNMYSRLGSPFPKNPPPPPPWTP